MWCIFLVVFGATARQTDWMGGNSVLGPVNDWGTQYWMSDSVTSATPGQVSLVATSWNYANWPKHIVESNSGIKCGAQGFMPADVDGDGLKDLVAHSNNEVVWYKNLGSYNFTKTVIGNASDGGSSWFSIYPCDLDQDGDIDVLVATNGVGLGWYENQNLSWVWHSLDNLTGWHRVSFADVELDGDMDIIGVDGGSYSGDIYLFRNNGSQNFTKELVANLPNNGDGWRVYPQDFNNDGYPDIYAVAIFSNYVFINNQSGSFIQVFHSDYWMNNVDFDGAWPSDIDMDGDIDLVCGIHFQNTNANGFYALLNDGTGTNFTLQSLSGTGIGGIDYCDGSISADIDLDGYPDIAGSYTKVGWFRQDPLNSLNFSLYHIDSVGNAHWVYTYPLCGKCIPSIDLLVTDQGAHIVYENRMLDGFANVGYLESSILELTPATMQACTLKYFAYNACVPIDTTLCFYWRAGLDSTATVNNLWNGPYYATAGMNVVDSFALSGIARMFQYKAEFRRAPNDISVLYEVWLAYNCPPFGVEEMAVGTDYNLSLQFVDGKLVLYLPQKDRVGLAVYDIAGRLAKNVFDGHLPSGVHEFEVPKSNGIYFARLQSAAGTRTLKFIKLK